MECRVARLLLAVLLLLVCTAVNPKPGPRIAGSAQAQEQTAGVPRVLWKAKLKDGGCSQIEVLDNGNILAARGYWACELLSPDGESLYTFPTDRAQQDKWRPLFGPDGSRYLLALRWTTNPRTYYYEITAFDPAGRELWTKRAPERLNSDAYMGVTAGEIILTGFSQPPKEHPLDRKTVVHRLSLDGELLQSIELDHEDRMYGYQPLDNGNYISGREGYLRCLGPDGKLSWEYTAYGFRRGFKVFPDGTAYALLKAPERVVKVGADGQVAWVRNLPDHAAGELNSYFDFGHAHGGYIDVAPDGTVYVCTAYSELTAIGKNGQYLWSAQDPRATGDDDWLAGHSLDYLSEPSVAPDGTIYLCADRNTLMAVSPEGRVLFTDERYAWLSIKAAFGADGAVYIESSGWLYALDPSTAAAGQVLAEQEEILAAERQRDAEREQEWEEERRQMEAELAEQAEETGQEPEELLEEYYGGWSPESDPAPAGLQIADRTVVAAEIIRGLMAYYEDHGEWPPFLLGVKYEEDPLIAGGYLEAYPLAWPQPGCYCRESTPNTDERDYVRWFCAVSTPGEPDLPAMNVNRARQAGQPAQRLRPRCLSIGPKMHDTSGWSFFGYQRGEWLGRDEQSCWLWLYGSNIWPEQNNPIPPLYSNWQAMEYYDLFRDFHEFGPRGFDLLNDQTGELIPDGKRDGICLLYKLVDGELAEVIRADGI